MTGHNANDDMQECHQWWEVASMSMNQVANWVIKSGKDPTKLGTWVWTQYRGRNSVITQVTTEYWRCAPFWGGVTTVYAQHHFFLDKKDDDRCPRKAFLEDLVRHI